MTGLPLALGGGFTLATVKPRLFIQAVNPDVTVAALRDALAISGRLYDRGVPVRLAWDHQQGGSVAHPMTPDGVIREAHLCSRPYRKVEIKGTVVEKDTALPRPIASMYLDMKGEHGLPPLNGIASAPLLDDSGGVHAHEGYDHVTGMWCERVPPGLASMVPDRPTEADARRALMTLRRLLRTFAFADSVTVAEAGLDIPVVDLERNPGADESAALAMLLTAICRPSLPLAPGALVRAASLSGAGSGKGLLVRVFCAIAFGRQPAAITAGGTPDELEKRIGAELMSGAPVLFLDNLNDTALRSDALASAITEKPARMRVLGKSASVQLNASALIVLTGNGLTVREDLARRFIVVELDPRVEDPEARRFPGDVLVEALRDRAALLAAALTIWRWGRHLGTQGDLTPGLALGSFAAWGKWVRDPLLALSCRDPAKRVSEAKAGDRKRQHTIELYRAWHADHGPNAMKAAGLADGVKLLLDPQNRGRQFQAAALSRLVGTRAGGFVLAKQDAAGVWGPSTYAVQLTGNGPETPKMSDREQNHRTHRDHRGVDGPDAPYDADGFPAAAEKRDWEGAL